ncbi:hypothetical protein GCM10011492_30930 [Flexivirga endophytica]|uniref:PqqD family protein n=1 Tax=Flexivirga endophytica TaxID=1849103 RepID=A0A916TAL5_9MICO|nr:PqqD family protein [Flexivirga endophytica]GGB38040.1 hypothetical protein GCM10011492_30930 [Flexivirga endophytica]GHB45988.1 hypothetical protein GCM10008112_13320 [Flexivirga endophytica]
MSCFRQSAQVAVARRDDRVFIAQLLGNVVVLQGNATIIWDCVNGSSEEDIVRRVAARAGVPDRDVADEVRVFLSSLCQDGLLIAD